MINVKISRPAVAKTSAAGRAYFVQRGLAQLFDRDGLPEEAPRIVEFMCDEGYPAGEYTISPSSFGVGQYDKLEIRRLVLTPSGAGAKAQSPAK